MRKDAGQMREKEGQGVIRDREQLIEGEMRELQRFRELAARMSAEQKRKVIPHLLEKAGTP